MMHGPMNIKFLNARLLWFIGNYCNCKRNIRQGCCFAFHRRENKFLAREVAPRM